MATYTVDKIGYNNNEYVLQDSGALQLTGGSVTGPVTFSDNISVDTINSTTVGSSPKFTDTTYALSNALSSHKFTSTLTAGGSGSGTSTATIELVAGTGITLTDDTTNKKITIASSVTNTDTKLQVAAVTSGTTYYPIVGTGTTAATRQYDTTGFIYKGTNGTTSAVGSSILTLGNSTASGTANNKQGQLVIYGSTAYAHTIQGAPTAARTLTLPNASGTVALTSDIPTVPSITLNGSSSTSPSFYAPTSAGTSGYYLKSSGSGAPTWTAFPTIPTVPSAGTSASAVGTSASGGSATTWSKSDHVHNITSSTITSALGYTPYNSTNPNGYTSNTGTVTGVKVNGTTINPTSGIVDIGTVATSDTKVTQNVISSDDTHSYPLLFSASTDGTTATTETALKSDTITFIRNDSDFNALNIGKGRVVLGRVHYYSNEDTLNQGTGIGIGTGDSSQNEMYYRTADGRLQLRHWSTDKGSDGSITTQFRDGIIDIVAGSSTPAIYMYSKTAKDTVSSYLRLRPTDLYINDGSAHQLNATGIDKVNALGTSTTICKTQHYTTALTSNTWYTFDSFTLAAGTWIVQCSATFNSTSSTGTRIIRLTTGNTSTTRVNWSCEATLGAHASSMNTLTFTTILNPTASTTYYLRAWSSLDVAAHATNNSGFVTYTRLI